MREGLFPARRLLAGIALVVTPAIASAAGFVASPGQLDGRAGYRLDTGNATVFVSSAGVVVDYIEAREGMVAPARRGDLVESSVRHRHAVFTRFLGVNPGSRIEAAGTRAERHHYLLGKDAASWRTGVTAHDRLVQRDAWPGVDLVYEWRNGELLATLSAANEAALSQVRWATEGADLRHAAFAPGLPISPGGDDASGGDHTLADPWRLLWSTYLGGSGDEIAWGTTVDSAGNLLVVGLTTSSFFPTTAGAYDESYNGFGDVFVSKFTPSGGLVWSTVLGGTSMSFDYGYAVCVDAADRPVVTGYTFSEDFPTTAGAFETTHHEYADAFVAKMSAAGDDLVWSTFLAGDAHDIGYSVALDSQGRPVIGGRTLSTDFPLSGGALQPFPAGEEDGFLTKLSADGSQLVWSTYFGGEAYDGIERIALDSADRVAVFGFTASTSFPTSGGVDDSFNGGLYDAFAARIGADGSAALWSRYLGGSEAEYGNALDLDASGNLLVAGQTESSDFPVTGGALDTSFNGGGADAYVAKLSAANGSVLWATFLGGSVGYYETIFGLAARTDASVVVCGSTPSPDFPTAGQAFDTSFNGGGDVFVAHLAFDGGSLPWSSFVGGSLEDYGFDLALATQDEAVVVGSTASTNYPTTFGSYDRTYNGSDSDVFLSRLRFDSPSAVDLPMETGALLPFAIAPNPIADRVADLRFRLPAEVDTRLELWSIEGRRLESLDLGRLDGGIHELAWTVPSRLSAGVYYLRLVAGELERSTPVRVAR